MAPSRIGFSCLIGPRGGVSANVDATHTKVPGMTARIATERGGMTGLAAAAARTVRQNWKIATALIGILVLWEIFVRGAGIKPYILPAPSVVLASLWQKLPTVLAAAGFTVQPMLIGFAVAVVVGILLALVVAFSPTLQDIIYPLIVFLQIVPKIAVAPLFIIWFGYGLMPKILLVFLLSFFPVVVSAVTAFRSVDTDIMDLAKATGAGAWRIFWKVQVPHALPTLFTGIKVAAALSSTAAVVAEFVASDRGLGYLLLEYNGTLNTSMAFAVIIVLSVMGLALYGIVEVIERLMIPWHVSRRRDETQLINP
jgi:NitT/TauT family transport system permease protein